MIPISYFDLSIGQSQGLKSGSEIAINDLLHRMSLIHRETFTRHSFPTEIDYSINLFGTVRPTRWERTLSAIIFCISGQIPTRQEVLRGRQIIGKLPRWFTHEYLSNQLVFGLLPYLLTGMKFHLESRFLGDSNHIDDAVSFLVHLFSIDEVHMESFLCAHRGHSEWDTHVLVPVIDKAKAQRALSLEMAILANLPHLKEKHIKWYQQGATAKASSNMFPEMFLQYMRQGRVFDMLITLEQHFGDMKDLLKTASGSTGISAEVLNLDSHTSKVCAYLEQNFGTDWRLVDYRLTHDNRPLVAIAVQQALPEVERFMPFYSMSGMGQLATRQNLLAANMERAASLTRSGTDQHLAARTMKAIDWFFYNQLMHISAKALYEATFFYLWGRKCASDTALCAVGIDRDHTRYQHESWLLGCREGCVLLDQHERDNTVLYARRTPEELAGGSLNDLSFRQFWR